MQLETVGKKEVAGLWTGHPAEVRQAACTIITNAAHQAGLLAPGMPLRGFCCCEEKNQHIDWAKETRAHRLVGSFMKKNGMTLSANDEKTIVDTAAASKSSKKGRKFDIVDHMGWEPGTYGEATTSCWWQSYWRARLVSFPYYNGRAVRAYHISNTSPAGRALLFDVNRDFLKKSSEWRRENLPEGFIMANVYGIPKDEFLTFVIAEARRQWGKEVRTANVTAEIPGAYLNDSGYCTLIYPADAENGDKVQKYTRNLVYREPVSPSILPAWAYDADVYDAVSGSRKNPKKMFWVRIEEGEGMNTHTFASDLKNFKWIPDVGMYPLPDGVSSYAKISLRASDLEAPRILYGLISKWLPDLKIATAKVLIELSALLPEDCVESEAAKARAIPMSELTAPQDTAARTYVETFVQDTRAINNAISALVNKMYDRAGAQVGEIERARRLVGQRTASLYDTALHDLLVSASNLLSVKIAERIEEEADSKVANT